MSARRVLTFHAGPTLKALCNPDIVEDPRSADAHTSVAKWVERQLQ